MANDDHIAQLMKGVASWNAWREENATIRPDLSRADLHGADLHEANLSEANLSEANLSEANLSEANLSKANLNGADLTEGNLSKAKLENAYVGAANLSGANLGGAQLLLANLQVTNLSGANLGGAHLVGAHLAYANFSGADLSRAWLSTANLAHANFHGANLIAADLRQTVLLGTDLTGADLTDCHVFGVCAWDLKLEGAKQQDLIITHLNEPEITVDNIEVAQFIYLLLHNEKIRDVIDTIGKKGVLLLGRFTEGRIEVLEGLREKLRSLGFVPMVFNFDKPETKDFTETVRLLANLSRFVIVDITNPRSTPLELQATVSDYMVPFVPILEQGQAPFAMFVDLQNKYDWVLDVIAYPSVDRLLEVRPMLSKLKK